MPSRNIYKTFVKDGYYHVYNRGVEKRIIFQEQFDFKVFLNYLKEALSVPTDPLKNKINFTLKGTTFKGIPRITKNFYNKIDLFCFCLMPNHFHLLLKQNSESDLQEFMQSLIVRYSMYFNKKYKRVGQLFQGRYKAVLVTEDRYLLHLSRYIHLNPSEYSNDLTEAYSSYADYLKLRNTEWVKPNIILKFFERKVFLDFQKFNSYKSFVENYKDKNNILGKLTLEDE
jgi:putative transposase